MSTKLDIASDQTITLSRLVWFRQTSYLSELVLGDEGKKSYSELQLVPEGLENWRGGQRWWSGEGVDLPGTNRQPCMNVQLNTSL